MSTFDPQNYLNQTVEEANDTTLIPCPAGEFSALADKVEVKSWSSRDGSNSGIKIEILWEILDDTAKEVCGREKLFVRQQQMLDLTEDGALDMSKGKNIGLGRIREALDLNQAGQPFNLSMITGRQAIVKVSHREYEGNLFDEVKSVAKLV